MTVTAHEGITEEWIERALTAGGHVHRRTEGDVIQVDTEAGACWVWIYRRALVVRLAGALNDWVRHPGDTPEERAATLQRLQEPMQIARIVWYSEDGQLLAEYELSVHAGVSHEQLLVTLQAFVTDLAAARGTPPRI